MTTPDSETPQPRDIAVEQETPELEAALEAQSDAAGSDGARGEPVTGSSSERS